MEFELLRHEEKQDIYHFKDIFSFFRLKDGGFVFSYNNGQSQIIISSYEYQRLIGDMIVARSQD
jgi:hypothetical protein